MNTMPPNNKKILSPLLKGSFCQFRDGPLENLWGGGDEVPKKIFAQGKVKCKKIKQKNIRAVA